MGKITRREFLRGGAAMAVSLAAGALAPLLHGCGAEGAPAAVVPTVTPTPEMTPAPTFAPDAVLYETTVGMTNCYDAPGEPRDGFLGAIETGIRSEYLREEGEDTLLRLPGGMEVWVSSWMIDPVDAEAKARRDASILSERLNRERFLEMESRPLFTCAWQQIACRSFPEEEARVVYVLAAGNQVTVYGREGDFYLVKLPIGRFAYAPVAALFGDSVYRVLDGAVDLRMLLPEAEFELLFASRNNITGEALYPPIPMMEKNTAEHLKLAYDLFRADGFTLKVYDAYRPKSAQYKLYDAVQNGWFIANPYNGNSWHQLGRAIDMSLIDLKTGKELVMPTPMHTFSNDAARFNSNQWSDEVRENMEYMTNTMLSCGFTLLSTEWWHFQYEGAGGSMNVNLTLDELEAHPVWEYEQM